MTLAGVTRLYAPVILSTSGITPELLCRVLSRIVADKTWVSGNALGQDQGITRSAVLAALIHGEDALLRHMVKDLAALVVQSNVPVGDGMGVATAVLNAAARRIAQVLDDSPLCEVSSFQDEDALNFVSGQFDYKVKTLEFPLELRPWVSQEDQKLIAAVRDTYPPPVPPTDTNSGLSPIDRMRHQLRAIFVGAESFFLDTLPTIVLPEIDEKLFLLQGKLPLAPTGKVALLIGKNAISVKRTTEGDRLAIALKNVSVRISRLRARLSHEGEKLQFTVNLSDFGLTGSTFALGMKLTVEIEPRIADINKSIEGGGHLAMSELVWDVVKPTLKVSFVPDLDLKGSIKHFRDLLQAVDAVLLPGDVVPSEEEIGRDLLALVLETINDNKLVQDYLSKILHSKVAQAVLPPRQPLRFLRQIGHRRLLNPNAAKEIRTHRPIFGDGYIDVQWHTDRTFTYPFASLPYLPSRGTLFTHSSGPALMTMSISGLASNLDVLITRALSSPAGQPLLSPPQISITLNHLSTDIGRFAVNCHTEGGNTRGRELFKCNLRVKDLNTEELEPLKACQSELLAWCRQHWVSESNFHQMVVGQLPFSETTALVMDGPLTFGATCSEEMKGVIETLLHSRFAMPLAEGRWKVIATPGQASAVEHWLTLQGID